MSWRDRFREDNELLFELVGGWRGKIYIFAGIIVFAKQVALRWPTCDGTIGCGLSFVKGVLWGAVWPFYLLNYATDFVLVRPFG